MGITNDRDTQSAIEFKVCQVSGKETVCNASVFANSATPKIRAPINYTFQ